MRLSKGLVRSRSARRIERGATLVMMALMLSLALGMSALAIDYGMIKSSKAEAQRAMDAAALAGASAFLIADPEADFVGIADARAREYAKKHDVHRVQITDPEVTVEVDVPNKEVKASYTGGEIPLWFANALGIGTMRINATATAKATEAGQTRCLKPVALPDIWQNNNNTTLGQGNKPVTEDANANGVWDYVDKNNNGVIDPGEMEPWTFNTGDVYDPPVTGYGTDFRDGYGTGASLKDDDYGRQVLIMSLAPQDAVVESYFRTWGDNDYTLGTDSILAGIKGERCTAGALNTEYRQGNGAKVPLQTGWEYLINQDPSAHWDDSPDVNTVVGSSFEGNWLTGSPRVVVVGLYDPQYASAPNANPIEFTNFAKLWLDQRPCTGEAMGLGNCKNPITARFLGYVEGGTGGPTEGTLVWHIVLIK